MQQILVFPCEVELRAYSLLFEALGAIYHVLFLASRHVPAFSVMWSRVSQESNFENKKSKIKNRELKVECRKLRVECWK